MTPDDETRLAVIYGEVKHLEKQVRDLNKYIMLIEYERAQERAQKNGNLEIAEWLGMLIHAEFSAASDRRALLGKVDELLPSELRSK